MTRDELINKLGRRTAYDFEHEAASMLQRDGECIGFMPNGRKEI